MCRSIKRLREGTTPASDEEIHEAARQFVRKISGFGKPSPHNEEVFNQAIDEIAASSKVLLGSLQIGRPAASA
jgi:hypothetical protein